MGEQTESGQDGPLQRMTDARAREMLASRSVGRVVERIDDIIEVFPVNYGTDGERIVIRSAPGTKLAGMIAASELLFEVDHVAENHVWSVIARVRARLVETDRERAELVEIMPTPLLPTVKEAVVELHIDSLSGREFVPGVEPEVQPETVA